MTLTSRKLAVVLVVGVVLLLANLVLVTHWLETTGVLEAAQDIWSTYLTPTAISVIVALLVLLTGSTRAGSRCRVCGHSMASNASYCSECGSRA